MKTFKQILNESESPSFYIASKGSGEFITGTYKNQGYGPRVMTHNPVVKSVTGHSIDANYTKSKDQALKFSSHDDAMKHMQKAGFNNHHIVS